MINMKSCLRMTRGSGYALTAMVALARAQRAEASGSGTMTIHQLAKSYQIPEKFLVKVLQTLARSGLITAQRGNNGGVGLAHPASQISALDILEAYEGSYVRSSCIFFPARACEGASCPAYCPLRKEEEIIRNHLRHMSLEKLVDDLVNHPNIGDKEII